jgi:hypothetical protein
MKNGAAAGIRKIIYGVSIGGLPLQVAKTWQRKHYNTKLNEIQQKKRCFAPIFFSTAQRFSCVPSMFNSLEVKVLYST